MTFGLCDLLHLLHCLYTVVEEYPHHHPPLPPIWPPSGYNVTKSRRTGYGQIICGVLSVSIGIAAAIVVPEYTLSIVISICCPSVFFIAGILGIACAKNQTKRLIVGHLVMSILASLAAFLMCTIDVLNLERKYNGVYLFGVGSMVALIEFIIAIIAATVCCHGCCQSDIVTTQQTVVPNQSNPTVITNPQTMAAHSGCIQGYQIQANDNQGFNVPPQASQGVPSMPPPGAPPADPPPLYKYGSIGGVPMPRA